MLTVRTALNFARANEEIAADVFVGTRDKITTKFGRESPVLIFSPHSSRTAAKESP
jgi:hypothetical protein